MREDGEKCLSAAACRIALCAQKALLYEVSVTPKPGLVDRNGCGAHRDMDFFTFLDSASVLLPYFEACAEEGILAAGRDEAEGELLARLRGPGREAEREMLAATGGVNTHKGAIFLLGLLSAAAGVCQGRQENGGRAGAVSGMPAEEILRTAGAVASPALEDFSDAAAAETAGLARYRLDGCRGVRGEAAGGFPSVRDCALPVLRKALTEGRSLNDAGVEALLRLILCVEDTTLLKRCGSRKARDLEREKLRQLLMTETPSGAAARLDADWSSRGLSAGGCADLLGCAFFLLFIEKGSDIITRTVE